MRGLHHTNAVYQLIGSGSFGGLSSQVQESVVVAVQSLPPRPVGSVGLIAQVLLCAPASAVEQWRQLPIDHASLPRPVPFRVKRIPQLRSNANFQCSSPFPNA